MLMWVSNLAAWAWMPWVVLAVEDAWRRGGRSLCVAALAGAMQMLSGAPEIIVFTWGLLGVLWLCQWLRREVPRGWMLMRVLAVGALVAGLSAAQLLPFLDLLGHSTRDPGFSDAGWSMPLSGPANFLVPLFRAQENGGQGVFVQYDQYWTPSVYIGAGIVALALLAAWRVRGPRVWILAGAAGFGLLMALGGHGFLYPGIKTVLLPQRYWVSCALPHQIHRADAVCPALAGGLCGELASGQPAQFKPGRLEPPDDCVGRVAGVDRRDYFSGLAASGNVGEMAGHFAERAGAAGLFRVDHRPDGSVAARGWPRKQRLWALALLGVSWVDVCTHAPQINPTVQLAAYQPGMIRDHLQLGPPRFGEPRFMPSLAAIAKIRYLSLPSPTADYLCRRVAFYDDCNLLDDIPKTDGFFSVELREVTRLLGVMANAQAQGAELKGMLDYLGVGHLSRAGHRLQQRSGGGWRAPPCPAADHRRAA